MQNKFKKILLVASLSLMASMSYAQEMSVDNLKKLFSEKVKINDKPVVVDSINPVVNDSNLYEVVFNKTQLLYITKDGKTIFQGHLINVENMKSLTQDRFQELNKINFSELPKNPIILKKGKGERKIAVFADPNCIFCKKLEPELEALDNVTVSLYLLPILSPSSVKIANSVLCSKTPGTSWKSWMIEGKEVPENECEKGKESIKTNLEFSQKYGITGTPAIYFENGERTVGYIDKNAIETKFKEIAEAKKNIKKK